jgi:hypothetical protein
MTFRGQKHDVLSESRMREIRSSMFDERDVETGLWHEEEIGHRQSETGGNRDTSPVVTAPHLDSTFNFIK